MIKLQFSTFKITKMTITIVKSRNLADKYSHRFITGLEGAKADNNTTLMKINLVSLKIKPKTRDNAKTCYVLRFFYKGIFKM